MNPQLKAKFFRYKWAGYLFWGVLVYFGSRWGLSFLDTPLVEIETRSRSPEVVTRVVVPKPTAEASLDWAYVQRNSTRLRAVLGDRCHTDSFAISHYQMGDKVLVIQTYENGMVEVEADDQTKIHTHGCISNTLLGPENPNGKS